MHGLSRSLHFFLIFLTYSSLSFLTSHFAVSALHKQHSPEDPQKTQYCNALSSILVQINASALFPTFQARFVTDSNAHTVSIQDLRGMGLSSSQACSFVAYFAGSDDEVRYMFIHDSHSLTFGFQPRVALAQTAEEKDTYLKLDDEIERLLIRAQNYT